MFVLIYPFTSQIFCINNDTMQKFTYKEKNREDLLQYNGNNFTSRKNGSNFPFFFLGSRRDLNQRFPVALMFLSLFHTTRQQ